MSAIPHNIPLDVLTTLRNLDPMLWINPDYASAFAENIPDRQEILTAQHRIARSAALLTQLFPELTASQGIIESDLIDLSVFKQQWVEPQLNSDYDLSQQSWLLKADHALPIAGSVKARGGFHEVIAIAEQIALQHQLIAPHDDLIQLASAPAKKIFSEYSIAVGSTGNLGLSIGIMAAALGFKAIVHMSVEAKEWKKQRLRSRGVEVVEHTGDYAAAVEAGRQEALANPKCHFVDDEQSLLLFLGYAACAAHLAEQLAQAQHVVDAEHPLFVYIPCGVGGAPGGICFGLKAIFAEHVHCFFAEPVASPCMLVQLAAATDQAVSVYDIGLNNQTEADGLAVGLASSLVSPIMRSQLSGVFTVADDRLYENLYQLHQAEQIQLEPSAAAALHGPMLINSSPAAQAYLDAHQINIKHATHVIWSTGGSLVPAEEMQKFQARGLQISSRK